MWKQRPGDERQRKKLANRSRPGRRRLHQHAHHNSRGREATSADIAIGHLVWAVSIGAGFAAYFLFLPSWIAWLWVAEGLMLTVCLYWIHEEYDNPSSRLLQFAWFRRCRAWHGVHHAPSEDFSSAPNYAIGAPVMGLVADRLFGAFADRAPDRGPRTPVRQ